VSWVIFYGDAGHRSRCTAAEIAARTASTSFSTSWFQKRNTRKPSASSQWSRIFIAYALQVLTTVDFKDQLSLEAHEIDDVGAEGCLASERAAEGLLAQLAPQESLRSRHPGSQSAGVRGQVRRGHAGLTLSRPR
jgi:hypothetical protein